MLLICTSDGKRMQQYERTQEEHIYSPKERQSKKIKKNIRRCLQALVIFHLQSSSSSKSSFSIFLMFTFLSKYFLKS
jgi:hypothetical protein